MTTRRMAMVECHIVALLCKPTYGACANSLYVGSIGFDTVEGEAATDMRLLGWTWTGVVF